MRTDAGLEGRGRLTGANGGVVCRSGYSAESGARAIRARYRLWWDGGVKLFRFPRIISVLG